MITTDVIEFKGHLDNGQEVWCEAFIEVNDSCDCSTESHVHVSSVKILNVYDSNEDRVEVLSTSDIDCLEMVAENEAYTYLDYYGDY